MIGRFAWFVACLLGAAAVVSADEEPYFGTERAASVLNSPSLAASTASAVSNVVQPGVEHLYDITGEWRTGTSVAVYTFADEVPLLHVRVGYAVDFLPYVSVPLDLELVTTRYVLPVLPDRLEGWLNAGPLEKLWPAVDKYGMVGPWVGINFDRHEQGNDHERRLVGGVSLGAKVTF